jgi:nucleotide-binding universal stress UspA family protein
MIVVGYGASGRIRAALFGAIAHRVLDESDIPVLVVP